MSILTFTEAERPLFQAPSDLQLSYLASLTGSASALPSDDRLPEILFILKGAGICTLHNESHELSKGDIVLINRGSLRSFTPQSQLPAQAAALGLRRLQLPELPEGHFLPPGISPIISGSSILPLLTQLLQQMKKLRSGLPSPFCQEACNCFARALLLLILDLAQNSSALTQEAAYSLGERIKSYLDSHYLEELSLPQVAAGLRISPYYLSHIFKEYTGCSPMQYVTQLRIAEAQNLLISTAMSITDIAIECGYNNSNYFQSVFSKLVGMPPGKYRSAWK